MKLTKAQSLDLVKVLSHYETLVGDAGIAHVDVGGLCADLEDFVLNGSDEDEDACEAEDCDHDHEGDDDEEDEEDEDSDEDDSEEEDSEEPDESEDGEGDEADDESEEADEEGDGDAEEELDADSYALGSDLHDLKIAKAKIINSSVGDPDDSVTLEFEHTEGDDADVCDLLVSGEPVGPIVYVRRKGNELHVAEGSDDDRTWHRFSVPRFPKGWADALPLDDLVEIE